MINKLIISFTYLSTSRVGLPFPSVVDFHVSPVELGLKMFFFHTRLRMRINKLTNMFLTHSEHM